MEAARLVLYRLEDEERTRKHGALVGRFFRYRNCYSCPEKESDYWWLYVAVTAMDEHGSLRVLKFQTDKEGKVSIEPRTFAMGELFTDGKYIEITEADFIAARRELLQHIESALSVDAVDPSVADPGTLTTRDK